MLANRYCKRRTRETPSRTVRELTSLFDACFRIQREASEAAGSYIPLVVENVKGVSIPAGRKVPMNFHEHEKTGKPGRSFQSAAVAQIGRDDGTKQGGEWWHDPQSIARRTSSRSSARKAASAQIAKIPFELSSYIARSFRPQKERIA